MSEMNEEPRERTAAAKQIDRRNQRIEDYLSAALENECPRLANVGAANSDLMRVQSFVRQVMEDALTESSPSMDELAILTPGIDTMLKIAKQIDRYTQLELKLQRQLRDAAGSSSSQSAALDQLDQLDRLG